MGPGSSFTDLIDLIRPSHPRIAAIIDSVLTFMGFGIIGYFAFSSLRKVFLFSKKT